MATVLGELTLAFDRGTHVVTVEGTIPGFDLGVLDATKGAVPGLDLGALVEVWGPLQSASWSVVATVDPVVIPIPASVLLLGGALVYLFGVRRARA